MKKITKRITAAATAAVMAATVTAVSLTNASATKTRTIRTPQAEE